MQNRRYPKINIRSKNELAKHISYKGFSKDEALVLINDVIINFEEYWKDSKSQSEPRKDKYVRSAKGTPLGILLDKINKTILSRYDRMVPNFIFGGLEGLDHIQAVEYLLGKKR